MTDNNWIEWKWTREIPYPEKLETMVCVKFHDGSDDELAPSRNVSFWKNFYMESRWRNEISHYKVIK